MSHWLTHCLVKVKELEKIFLASLSIKVRPVSKLLQVSVSKTWMNQYLNSWIFWIFSLGRKMLTQISPQHKDQQLVHMSSFLQPTMFVELEIYKKYTTKEMQFYTNVHRPWQCNVWAVLWSDLEQGSKIVYAFPHTYHLWSNVIVFSSPFHLSIKYIPYKELVKQGWIWQCKTC